MALKKTVAFTEVPYAVLIEKSALTTKTWYVVYNGFLSEFRQVITTKILTFFEKRNGEKKPKQLLESL